MENALENIRRAMRNRARESNIATVARDIGVSAYDLDAFIYNDGDLLGTALHKLMDYAFSGLMRLDIERDTLTTRPQAEAVSDDAGAVAGGIRKKPKLSERAATEDGAAARKGRAVGSEARQALEAPTGVARAIGLTSTRDPRGYRHRRPGQGKEQVDLAEPPERDNCGDLRRRATKQSSIGLPADIVDQHGHTPFRMVSSND